MRNPITIYMADLVHDILPGIYVVPLNISGIAAYVKSILNKDAEIRLFKSPVDLSTAIKKDPPQILALSNYLWNRDLNLKIGEDLKRRFPDIVIAGGGPGVRTDSEGIKQFLKENSYLDIYTLFDGEQPFLNLIKKIFSRETTSGKGLKGSFADGEIIKGCAYLMDEDLIYSEHDMLSDLEVLPSPYLTGWLDEFLKKDFIPLFESNRGCPFSCSYCNWGVSALRRIRAFPLERICEEMEYVSKKNPDIPHWIIADANFGILKRDIEIAKKIKKMREQMRSLGRVYAWTTKNRPRRSREISEMLGDIENHLIAVQTFDPKVQESTGRANIRQEEIPAIARELKERGVGVSTDILCGLPLETAESHLKTLRKSFDIGFDFMGVSNVVLLQGSRLESDVSREQFSIKTKFRLSQGAYGSYDGIKAIECEEMIVATSTMSEEEMLEFRIIHWLIYFCWNTGFLKPLFRYLQSYGELNAMDLIVNLIRSGKVNYPRVDRLFRQFRLEAEEEKFDSPQELRRYYSQEDEFGRLLKGGFSKMNFKFTALFILDNTLYAEFCDLAGETVSGLTGKKIPDTLLAVIKELIIDVDSLFYNQAVLEKKIRVEPEIARLLLNTRADNHDAYAHINLSKRPQDIVFLNGLLKKYRFSELRRLAVEKSLEIATSGFSYQINKL